MTRSSPAVSRSRSLRVAPASEPAPPHAELLAELACAGVPHIEEVVERLLTSPPSRLAHMTTGDFATQVVWVVSAWLEEPPPPADEHGTVLVLRRRIIDLIRSELLRHWAAEPPEAGIIVDALARLERAREACVPVPDQAFAAELADHGGFELVVEVAHDMRSPLTSIMFLSEILHRGQSGSLTDVQRRQVGIIYSAALGLVGMASDMIEMAKGDNRLARRSPYAFSLNEVLSSVRDLALPTAAEKGVELRVGSLSAPHRLGYPVPLSRVLLNLTTNALRFTEQGYVEVSAVSLQGHIVEFAVRDTGSGISDEALETLYQPFKREPRRETGYAFSGTGLGLSICRRLVSTMGSQLELETRRGWGTRFSFQLELPPASLI